VLFRSCNQEIIKHKEFGAPKRLQFIIKSLSFFSGSEKIIVLFVLWEVE